MDVDIVGSVTSLLGGIALFLYAIKMTSGGLEAVAGNKLKSILQKLTSNRFIGVLMGALITALVQSSTTTTVMVVGFVNAQLMNLYEALWVIMGSNIGTNITSQLVAFDVSKFAPIICVIGVGIILMAKSKRGKALGDIVTGIGFIFIGMKMMTSSMAPIVDLPIVRTSLAKMENPILGILAGIIFVFIIQSSAGGVGVLQAMAMAAATSGAAAANAITVDQAIFILFGLNIGTCFHALLAAVGGTRGALRAACMHFAFNLIGTLIFTPVALCLPFTDLVRTLSPGDVARQIANAHLLFNLGTTIIMLPFGQFLVRFVMKIIPDKEAEEDNEKKLKYLTPAMLKADSHVGLATTLANSCYSEVIRMYDMAVENIEKSLTAVINNSEELQKDIDDREEYIDFLNKEISYYISHALTLGFSEEDVLKFSAMFKITGNIERMGDHATNISGYANLIEDKGYAFSDMARKEVQDMIDVLKKSCARLKQEDNKNILVKVAQDEQHIDDMTREYRANQLERMRASNCSGETSVIYSEMLTDFERLGDHLLNIAKVISENNIRALAWTKHE